MRPLVHDLSISQVKFATGPREGKEKPKKEADLSRLVAVVFRVHKGLIVYYFKVAYCGDLINKG